MGIIGISLVVSHLLAGFLTLVVVSFFTDISSPNCMPASMIILGWPIGLLMLFICSPFLCFYIPFILMQQVSPFLIKLAKFLSENVKDFGSCINKYKITVSRK